jgi:hypothetical protein
MNRKWVFAVISIVCLAGTLVSATLSVGVYDHPSYLVVRGSDNGIYYRLFNEASGTWGEWTKLPGSTCDSPSAAYIGEQLCVVVRGMDGSSMWQGFVNVNTGDFSGWTPISGSTPSAVELGSASTPSTGFESTGYISIPAAAFVSKYSGTNAYNAYIGRRVENWDSVTAYFAGAVQLPDGVTITNVTGYWYDADASEDIYCRLARMANRALNEMADVSSSGSAGYSSTVDTTVSFSTVDNSLYEYFLELEIPSVSPDYNLAFYYVTIGFAYPT